MFKFCFSDRKDKLF